MRFLLAWEMGHNFGHVERLSHLARAIAKACGQDYEFFFVLKTPSALQIVLPDLNYKLLQAPFTPPNTHGSNNVVTYMDDLRLCGYDRAQTLGGMLRAWRDLYTILKPDVLITDSAPTALLAARDTEIKTMVCGSGYMLPPKSVPMPLMDIMSGLSAQEIAEKEKEALTVINEALEFQNMKPLANIAEMLKADLECLNTFEELDHYPNRSKLENRSIEYLGNFFGIENGAEMDWNSQAEKRIFAYIRPGFSGFLQTLEAFLLLPQNIDIIVSAPGIDKNLIEKIARRNIRISTSPVKLKRLLKNCNLGISHASQATVAAFAMYGIPQFFLPAHAEQFLSAKALARNNLGTGLFGQFSTQDVLRQINHVLSNSIFKDHSLAFSTKYKNFKPENMADTMALRLNDLCQKNQKNSLTP